MKTFGKQCFNVRLRSRCLVEQLRPTVSEWRRPAIESMTLLNSVTKAPWSCRPTRLMGCLSVVCRQLGVSRRRCQCDVVGAQSNNTSSDTDKLLWWWLLTTQFDELKDQAADSGHCTWTQIRHHWRHYWSLQSTWQTRGNDKERIGPNATTSGVWSWRSSSSQSSLLLPSSP